MLNPRIPGEVHAWLRLVHDSPPERRILEFPLDVGFRILGRGVVNDHKLDSRFDRECLFNGGAAGAQGTREIGTSIAVDHDDRNRGRVGHGVETAGSIAQMNQSEDPCKCTTFRLAGGGWFQLLVVFELEFLDPKL